MNTANPFSLEFAHATHKPRTVGVIKEENQDFCVTEHLQTEFTGDGEHIYLYIEKQGENTHWLAKQLAEFAGIKHDDVGFSGLKDRNAVTRQWFSVHLPKGSSLNWQAFNCSTWQVLQIEQHRQKLRRGEHQDNEFKILVRVALTTFERSTIDLKLEHIKQTGVPNYFGLQRFGRDGGNLIAAQGWFVEGKKIKNRREKGLVLSAARSYVFNQLLSQRVIDGNWKSIIAGDVAEHGVPTGPLWGRGRLASSDSALEYETAVANQFEDWCYQMEHQGLKQERRALVLKPSAFSWQWLEAGLELKFTLAPGQYATTVLRELFSITENN